MNDIAASVNIFAEEAQTLLLEFAENLPHLPADLSSDVEMMALKRILLILQGSAELLGFKSLSSFCREVVVSLQDIQYEESELFPDYLSALSECKEFLRQLIAHYLSNPDKTVSNTLSETGNELLKRLSCRTSTAKWVSVEQHQTLESVGGEEITLDKCWLITLDFQSHAFCNGVEPLALLDKLRSLGEIKQILTLTPHMPAAAEMNPESCYLQFKIVLQSSCSKQDISAIFEYHDCDIKILPPNALLNDYLGLLNNIPDTQLPRLGEMLEYTGAITAFDVKYALQIQQSMRMGQAARVMPIGEILVERKLIQPVLIEHALKKQALIRQNFANAVNYISVDAKQLDLLIDQVGDLTVTQAAMNLLISQHRLTEIAEVVSDVNNLIASVRDTALRLRRVPIREVFENCRNAFAELGSKFDKQAVLEISGDQVMLDKHLLAQLSSLLLNLLRNSLEHGIETPAQRLLVGKPSHGSIRLHAYHEYGQIIIQIADDGAGIDLEQIKINAIKQNLIKPQQNLNEHELLQLLLDFGISSKAQKHFANGLVVVKKTIAELHGMVKIDSRLGEGSIVTLQLPLTQAVMEGFLIRSAKERYIIPLNMVAECIDITTSDCEINPDGQSLKFRGQNLPYLQLSAYFNLPESAENVNRQSIVVVKYGQNKLGLLVDELCGAMQVVLKPLDKIFANLPGISGATVLSDQQIALILDVQSLLQANQQQLAPQPLLNFSN